MSWKTFNRMRLTTIAMITLNTAPQVNALRTACHGSRESLSVFRIQTRYTRGRRNADPTRTRTNARERCSAMARGAPQRSSVRATCFRSCAWAAARRATGTRKGEQET